MFKFILIAFAAYIIFQIVKVYRAITNKTAQNSFSGEKRRNQKKTEQNYNIKKDDIIDADFEDITNDKKE